MKRKFDFFVTLMTMTLAVLHSQASVQVQDSSPTNGVGQENTSFLPMLSPQAPPTPCLPFSPPPRLIHHPILPVTTFPPKSPPTATTFYTYRAHLTFGHKCLDQVNVAELFRLWLFSSVSSIPNFFALPYENEKGIQLMSVDQLPEDNADFYRLYYCNHRLLNHGNLTGMVQFQCSVPWHTIKKPDGEYFKWLFISTKSF